MKMVEKQCLDFIRHGTIYDFIHILNNLKLQNQKGKRVIKRNADEVNVSMCVFV